MTMIEQIPLPVWSIVLVWLAWRVWTFTLRPTFHPDEVKTLPYSIPCIGHAIQLFRAPYTLYDAADKHFHRTQQPYYLQLAGSKIMVVTNARQISDIFADTVNYTYDDFIDLVYRQVGKVSDHAHQILWRTVQQGFQSLHPNPKDHVLVHTGKELLQKQFLSKEPFEMLAQKVLIFIDKANRWDNFTSSAILASDSKTKVLSLHHWVRDVMVQGQANAFFGPLLLDIEPNFTEIFDQWDKNSWMISFQYPDFLAKPAIEARERIVDICTKFLDTNGHKIKGNVAFVEELTDEMQAAGLVNNDCARVLMIIMWAINSNVQLATFWMMNHILRDPELHASIITEIEPIMPIVDATDLSDSAALREICRTKLVEGCPLLNATFDEVVRVCSTGMSLRKTTNTVTIDNKHVPADTAIFMPHRQLLLDKNVFGQDAEEFHPQRFLQNKMLLRHENYRPFGGGNTYCSGKTMARYEMLAFVAWCLWRFNLRVVKPGEEVLGVKGMEFPRLDLKRPSLGVSKQVEGDNLIIEVTKRER